ncbi:MAG TPA: GatB/YqeY domain-containing protein, partial [Myxococcota bacterium]
LYKDIGAAWKEAMKARDPKKDVLALMRTEVKNKIINTRTDATAGAAAGGEIDAPDDVTLEVLKKMAKQRRESIDEYNKGGRQDLVDKEQAELTVIESFLPQALDAATIAGIVKEAIAECGAVGAKDMGKAMKAAMGKIAGRADGKDVQAAVKAALGSSALG